MIRGFFSRLWNRDGQALILCAIIFPLVLLFLAFVVDYCTRFCRPEGCIAAKHVCRLRFAV